ncbi:MAG: hypothetical protein E4H33_03340, partial [Anaerolineales bacterium]
KPMSDIENTLTCTFHPKRETQLRCNRCEKPICIKCAIHTPTGYRCQECIRSQQKIFVTTKWFDYIRSYNHRDCFFPGQPADTLPGFLHNFYCFWSWIFGCLVG